MSEIREVNARIESTNLGVEDHGILTVFIYLDYGGTSQGFGGHFLDDYDEKTNKRTASKACGLFVKKVLEVVGVENWEDLPGKFVRVKCEHSKIHEIGNIIEDKWFNPSKELEKLEEND